MKNKKISRLTVCGLVACGLAIILAGVVWKRNATAENNDLDLLHTSQRAIRNADYAEGLKALTEYYERSFQDGSCEPVRSVSGMQLWAELSSHYPPALEKMKEIRDSREAALRSGDLSDIEFHPFSVDGKASQQDKAAGNALTAAALFRDVVNLNRVLKDESRTLDFFEYLERNHPEWAKACWRTGRAQIMKSKRYDLALKYLPDLHGEFERKISYYRRNLTVIEPRLAKSSFVNSVYEILEMSVATNQLETAKLIAKEADAILKMNDFEKFVSRQLN